FESLESRTLLTGSPQIVSTTFDYIHGPPSIKVQFDQDVSTSLSLSDLVLMDEKQDAPLDVSSYSLSYSYDSSTNTATFQDVNQKLWGNYVLAIAANSVTNAQGQPLQQGLYFPFWIALGDINRDRHTDQYDYVTILDHLNTAGTFLDGDVNY